MPYQSRQDRAASMKEVLDARVKEHEENIAHALFLRHNRLLENGKVDGHHMWLDFTYERSGGANSFYSSYNGKIRLYIGGYGDKRCFRENKDKKLRIDEIADEIHNRIDRSRAQDKQEDALRKKRAANERAAKDISEELNISEYSNGLNVNYKTGSLTFSTYSLTPEQAKRFLELGLEMGVFSQKSS